MNTPKKLMSIFAILLLLITSSYPFIVFKLQGELGFSSKKADNIFHWTLFALWSVSLWILGFLYNRLSTADIKMFIVALMAVIAAAILFNDIASHLGGYGNGEEKVIYLNKTNKRKWILQRFHGAGAIGSDYYDTIYIYQITKWVCYEEEFKRANFDSSQWVNFIPTQK